MKKVIKLLLAALLSFAIFGCSDSGEADKDYVPEHSEWGFKDYETFSKARSAWKEPSSYSYTITATCVGFNYIIDVNVTNGEVVLSHNPKEFQFDGKYHYTPEDECKMTGFTIGTITELFESIENRNKEYAAHDYKNDKHCYGYNIGIKYTDSNNMLLPVYVYCGEECRKDVVGVSPVILKINDFKILSE